VDSFFLQPQAFTGAEKEEKEEKLIICSPQPFFQ